MLLTTLKRQDLNSSNDRCAKPFCQCWSKRDPISWKQLSACTCGEDNDVKEWNWENPDVESPRWVLVSEDGKQVTFHPCYSSGTAAVKGDTPLRRGYHYYWEVKMLTDTYGTDIMVGLGSDKVNMAESQFKFTSLLGQDCESYGLSYTGTVRHAAHSSRDCAGFCRGSLVGLRVDMWHGTLEFYVNRIPQGVSFFNLRRHAALFPMLCSTAAQSSFRLTYAASWRASLLVDAARGLSGACLPPRLPPGLVRTLRQHFWLTLPTQGCAAAGEGGEGRRREDERAGETAPTALAGPYVNGFYVDHVDRGYRLAVCE